MAFQFISPEIDPYIGAVIVVAIFGFIVYLISHIKGGEGRQGGTLGPAGSSGGGGGGRGIFKRLWDWIAGKKNDKDTQKKETLTEKEEDKRESEVVQEEGKTVDIDKNLPEVVGEAVESIPDVLDEEEKKALDKIKPTINNIFFLLQSAEDFFKLADNRFGTIGSRLTHLGRGAGYLIEAASKEKEEQKKILNEVGYIERLLGQEINSLEIKIANCIGTLERYNKLRKKKREMAENAIKNLEGNIKKLTRELNISKKLAGHLEVKKKHINDLISNLSILEKKAEELYRIRNSLKAYEEETKKDVEEGLGQIKYFKQLASSSTFKKEGSLKIYNYIFRMILQVLKKMLIIAKDLLKIIKEIHSITVTIHKELKNTSKSLIDSKTSAKEFKKICKLEKNQEQKKVHERIIEFDNSLIKKTKQNQKGITKGKSFLHKSKKRIKSSIKYLENEISYYYRLVEEVYKDSEEFLKNK